MQPAGSGPDALGDAEVYAALGISEAEWDETITDDPGLLPVPALPAESLEAGAGAAGPPTLQPSAKGLAGKTLADSMPAVLPLFGSAGASLKPRPANLSLAREDIVGGADILFREERGGAAKRRYDTAAKGSPLDLWKAHGGRSVNRLTLPPELQPGDAPQELVRRAGKVTRPGDRPTLRFHQYEIRGSAGAPKSSDAGVVIYHVLGEMAKGNKRARYDYESSLLGRSDSSVEGISTSTEEEDSSSSGGGSRRETPPSTTVPVLDLGNGVAELMGLRVESGSGAEGQRQQRQRTSDGFPFSAVVPAVEAEGSGWGSNLWHSSVSVATVGTGMYVYNHAARGGMHGGRELLEETHGLLHDAGGALMDAVTFLDTEFARLYESELFRLSERVLLMAVAMMVVVDMLFDLRRAPAVDRVVTLGLRQTAIRFMFFVRTVVSSCPPKPFSIRPAFPTLVSKWYLGDACCARRRWRGGGWGCGAGSS